MSVIARAVKSESMRVGMRYASAGMAKRRHASIALDDAVEWEEAKPYRSIPGPKPLPVPYIGNFWKFGKYGPYANLDSTKLQRRLRQEFGDIVRMTGLGHKELIFLFDPSFIEKMHRNESAWPIRDGLECVTYYQKHLRKDIYADFKSLPSLQGKEWHEVRSAVNPTMLQPRRTKIYTRPIVSIASEFIERVKAIRDDKLEMPDDFANELNKWALESIAFVALDTHLGCLANNPDKNSRGQRMISAVSDMFDAFFHLDIRPSLWKYVSTARWKKFVKTMDYITDFAYGCVNARIKAIQNQEGHVEREPKSVLEALLRSQNKNFAVVMAMDMLIAGIDTTSNGVATTLSLLAANPEKQEKLFGELKSFLKEKDTEITHEMLCEMKYLKASIKEAFRMKPVAPGNTRTTVKDLVIGGYQIPKGTKLVSCNNALSVDEKHFKQPEDYIPERWLKSERNSELSSSAVNPFIFLPFGFGTRMCIGRRFAELELEVIIAKLVRNFRISYHYGEMEWVTTVLTKPGKPLKFRMEDRRD